MDDFALASRDAQPLISEAVMRPSTVLTGRASQRLHLALKMQSLWMIRARKTMVTVVSGFLARTLTIRKNLFLVFLRADR